MVCMQIVQHGSVEVHELARFTQSCLATLTVAYKQAKLSQQVGSVVGSAVGSAVGSVVDSAVGSLVGSVVGSVVGSGWWGQSR